MRAGADSVGHPARHIDYSQGNHGVPPEEQLGGRQLGAPARRLQGTQLPRLPGLSYFLTPV